MGVDATGPAGARGGRASACSRPQPIATAPPTRPTAVSIAAMRITRGRMTGVSYRLSRRRTGRELGSSLRMEDRGLRMAGSSILYPLSSILYLRFSPLPADDHQRLVVGRLRLVLPGLDGRSYARDCFVGLSNGAGAERLR